MPGARARTRNWLRGHRRDLGVRRAQRDGYRSRAAYKLIELDAAHDLLAGARRVLDLGAAPGSWCQVVTRRAPAARVAAIDLCALEPLAKVAAIRGDFTEADVQAAALAALGGAPDLILCDAAPALSGIAARDQGMFERLHRATLALCAQLRPAQVVVKSYTGDAAAYLKEGLARSFAAVVTKRPKASRGQSSECYLLGKAPRSPYNT